MRLPWLAIAAGIIAGGIIHIAAVLGMPYLASNDSWQRLASLSSPNQMYVLPLFAPGAAPLPMMAPDIGYAFCRFDLSKENVVIEADIPDTDWSAAIYTRYGENFYVISGADARRDRIRMLLIPRARLAEEASTERTEEGDEQIIVITPGTRGTILIRALIRSEAYQDRVLSALQSASCTAVDELDATPGKLTPPGFPPLPGRANRGSPSVMN